MSDDALNSVSRRNFLKAGTCGFMSIGPVVNTIAQLKLVQAAATSSVSSSVVGTDYKAMVCLFLRGGCDMNNFLIPIGGNSQKEAYQRDRATILVSEEDISNAGTSLNTPSVQDQQFGMHPSMPKLAQFYNDGKAAMVTNVGTLAEPTTRDTYTEANLPRQLFSHSDQVTQWMSSVSDQDFSSGWGGRVGDLVNDTFNPDGNLSMLVTAAGNTNFLVSPGGSVPQYTVTSTGAISLSSFGSNYANALESDGLTYKSNASGQRLKAMEQIMAYSHSHILENGYNTIVKRSRDAEAKVSEAISAAKSLSYIDSVSGGAVNVDFSAVFATHGAADTGLGKELLSIVNLIAGRESVGNKRQVFFVDLGGFDDHSSILENFGPRLTLLDNAVAAFQECLDILSLADSCFETDQVTLFQASDFNRTWTANSDSPEDAGTDHAWGTHTFVIGGAVKGGQIYGRGFPELAVGGLNDVPKGSRGRWIPTTSVDEYSSVLAHWFGVSYGSSEMETIFPNLNRFLPSGLSAPPEELNFFHPPTP